MLSPGKYHLSVPTDPKQNRLFRRALVRKCQTDLAFRAEVLEACKRDVVFWINVFGWQVNPRSIGDEIGPFILRAKQREHLLQTIHWLYDLQVDVLWEKSRYQGATWKALLKDVWLGLFHRWKKFLWISHNEKAVDDDINSDSLFWKVNFIHEHVPAWMSRGVWKRKGGFEYPATNSLMNGAATTERAGVGGRATSVGLDEFSKQRDDFKILGQTADTGPRLFIGTHYGVGTAFHSLTLRPDMHKCVMHWSESGDPIQTAGLYKVDPATRQVKILDTSHKYPEDYPFVTDGSPTGGPFPGIRSVWYDFECRRRNNARDVAMHLDIDPKGSSSQFFDAMTIHGLRKKTWSAVWEGDVTFDRDTGVASRLTRREGGPLRLWFEPGERGQSVPADLYTIGSDPSEGTGATPSCASIVRAKTGEKVGEYLNPRIRSESFAALLVALARLFRDEYSDGARLVWESLGPGTSVGLRVVELGYKRIHYRTDIFDMRETVSEKPGWFPTPETKLALLQAYRDALVTGEFSNPSDRALEQTLDFRYDARGYPEHPGQRQTEDPAAGGVNHGDMVMADALAWMLAKDHAGQAEKVKRTDVPFMSYAWRRQQRHKAEREEAYSEVWEG